MRTFDVDVRRGFVEAAVVWVVAIALGSCLFGQGSAGGGQAVDSLPDEAHTQRPNIVLIVVDDLDWFKDHQLYKESGYLTDIITRHTLDFMSRNRDQPFFAFVSHALLRNESLDDRTVFWRSETEPTEREIAELMLDLPQPGRDPDQINFRELPRLRSEHAIISDVLAEDGGRVNQHAYLAHHDGRYWAMWSDGPGALRGRDRVPGHDLAAQRVSFATSVDGMVWSETHDLSGSPAPGFGFIARGYWQRDGELLALASHFRAPGYDGEGLSLEAFRLDATNRHDDHLMISFSGLKQTVEVLKVPLSAVDQLLAGEDSDR